MTTSLDSSTPTESTRSSRFVDLAIATIVVLTAAMSVSHHNADPDLWGHVRYGLDAIRHGLPDVNTYSYNAPDHPWINHENLAELAMAVGLTKLGPTFVLSLKVAAGGLMFASMYWWARRQGVSQLASAAGVWLASLNLMHFWVMRPQLFSYVCFAFMIAALTWIFESWQPVHWSTRWSNDAHTDDACSSGRLRWLWLAPILFAVWTNTHGAFAAGYCIFAVYLALRSLEALWARRPHAVRFTLQAVSIVALSGLATLLNPYGVGLHQWMLGSLGSPRPEITEWLSPRFDYVWAPFWMLVGVSVVAWSFSRKSRDLTQALILLAVLSQAFAHRRHIAFLAILTGYWLCPHIESLLVRLRKGVDEKTFGQSLPNEQRLRFAGVLMLMTALMLTAIASQLQCITVKRDQYPVAAFQYMSDQGMRGKLVTRFMWAQYAISAFGSDTTDTGIQVAFDGRFRTCYPQDVVDMYFDFAVGSGPKAPRWRGDDSPPMTPERILSHNMPDLALVDRKQKHAVRTIQAEQAQWTLLYQDQLAQLWGRTSVYGDPTNAYYIPPEKREVSETEQTGYAAWPAHPRQPNATRRNRQPKTVSHKRSADAWSKWSSYRCTATRERLPNENPSPL